MSVARPAAAVALGLVAWFLPVLIGSLVAVGGASGGSDTEAIRGTVVASLVVGAALAAVVSVLVLRGDESRDRPSTLLLVTIPMLWPVVFGIGGILDGRAPGEPALQGVVVLVLGVGVAGAITWSMTRRSRRPGP